MEVVRRLGYECLIIPFGEAPSIVLEAKRRRDVMNVYQTPSGRLNAALESKNDSQVIGCIYGYSKTQDTYIRA